MNNTENKSNYVIMDIASIIIITTGTLYIYGLSSAQGSLIGYGLSLTLLSMDAYSAIASGFLHVIATPIFLPFEAFVSFSIFIYAIYSKVKNKISINKFYVLIALFCLSYFVTIIKAGHDIAADNLNYIKNYKAGETLTKQTLKKVIVSYESDNNIIKSISGFDLGVPGSYVVVATSKNITAIKIDKVISISFAIK